MINDFLLFLRRLNFFLTFRFSRVNSSGSTRRTSRTKSTKACLTSVTKQRTSWIACSAMSARNLQQNRSSSVLAQAGELQIKHKAVPRSSSDFITQRTSDFRVTGFLTMKVGKIVAVSVGGSIILLQIASNEGYITIDWSKITKKANKLADKAEEAITGEGPSWADKVRINLLNVVSVSVIRSEKRPPIKFQIKSFVTEHSYTATAFAGGFLIGITFS